MSSWRGSGMLVRLRWIDPSCRRWSWFVMLPYGWQTLKSAVRCRLLFGDRATGLSLPPFLCLSTGLLLLALSSGDSPGDILVVGSPSSGRPGLLLVIRPALTMSTCACVLRTILNVILYWNRAPLVGIMISSMAGALRFIRRPLVRRSNELLPCRRMTYGCLGSPTRKHLSLRCGMEILCTIPSHLLPCRDHSG